jgi:hypothetical protein
MWEAVVVDYFNLLSQKFHGDPEENQEYYNISVSRARFEQGPNEYEAEMLFIQPRLLVSPCRFSQVSQFCRRIGFVNVKGTSYLGFMKQE